MERGRQQTEVNCLITVIYLKLHTAAELLPSPQTRPATTDFSDCHLMCCRSLSPDLQTEFGGVRFVCC